MRYFLDQLEIRFHKVAERAHPQHYMSDARKVLFQSLMEGAADLLVNMVLEKEDVESK